MAENGSWTESCKTFLEKQHKFFKSQQARMENQRKTSKRRFTERQQDQHRRIIEYDHATLLKIEELGDVHAAPNERSDIQHRITQNMMLITELLVQIKDYMTTEMDQAIQHVTKLNEAWIVARDYLSTDETQVHGLRLHHLMEMVDNTFNQNVSMGLDGLSSLSALQLQLSESQKITAAETAKVDRLVRELNCEKELSLYWKRVAIILGMGLSILVVAAILA